MMNLSRLNICGKTIMAIRAWMISYLDKDSQSVSAAMRLRSKERKLTINTKFGVKMVLKSTQYVISDILSQSWLVGGVSHTIFSQYLLSFSIYFAGRFTLNWSSIYVSQTYKHRHLWLCTAFSQYTSLIMVSCTWFAHQHLLTCKLVGIDSMESSQI